MFLIYKTIKLFFCIVIAIGNLFIHAPKVRFIATKKNSSRLCRLHFLVIGRVTELRAHPQNSLKILHFYGMDARVSQ